MNLNITIFITLLYVTKLVHSQRTVKRYISPVDTDFYGIKRWLLNRYENDIYMQQAAGHNQGLTNYRNEPESFDSTIGNNDFGDQKSILYGRPRTGMHFPGLHQIGVSSYDMHSKNNLQPFQKRSLDSMEGDGFGFGKGFISGNPFFRSIRSDKRNIQGIIFP